MIDSTTDARTRQILEEFERLRAQLEPFTVNIHGGEGRLLRVSATLKAPANIMLQGQKIRLIDLALLAQNKLERFDASPSLRNTTQGEALEIVSQWIAKRAGFFNYQTTKIV
ncbi:MAG TPA: hypothetical protein PK198_22890 [Saprospiraceae bacterium]|nr:hypothetical protein [Saprospiraceae bacterium]HRK81759.1 hypothetical protein [Saprospiraceae bacterium]